MFLVYFIRLALGHFVQAACKFSCYPPWSCVSYSCFSYVTSFSVGLDGPSDKDKVVDLIDVWVGSSRVYVLPVHCSVLLDQDFKDFL